MTKKDYKMIAEAINRTCRKTDWMPIYTLEEELCETFKQDNPRFDRERFLAACRGS